LAVVAQETLIFPAFLPSSGGEDLDSQEQASFDAQWLISTPNSEEPNLSFKLASAVRWSKSARSRAESSPQLDRSVNLLQESHDGTMCRTSTDVSMGG